MQNSKKQTFLQGAMVLIFANAVVKVIGAIFKIPLTNLIGDDGMGLFTVAYNLYTFMFVLSTAGLPVAVSKMVAEANALGRPKEVRRIVEIAFITFVTIGAVASLIMFFGAGAFVNFIKNDMAYKAVLAISPAVFFVAISSTFRGYYQGMSNMYPTAISQVIESVFKLVAGFGLAYIAIRANLGLEWAAAGAIGGVTIGTVFSALYLILKRKKGRVRDNDAVLSTKARSRKKLLFNLIRIVVPVTIGASVLSLTNFIDMAVVMNRLQDVGYSAKEANRLYGAYSSMAVTLFNLPQTLITALSISIIPAISAAFAQKNYRLGAKTIESSTRITVMMALPCAAGLTVLSGPILSLLFYKQPRGVETATPLLSILGMAVLFVGLVSLTNSILQAIGSANVPVVTMFIGGLVKLTTNYILVGNPNVNIHGAPIGTTLCYLTITILNLFAIAKITHCLPRFHKTFVKPAIATVGMASACFIVYKLFSGIIGSKLSVLLAIGVSAVVYILLLLSVRALEKEDVLMMPKGEKLVKILRMK